MFKEIINQMLFGVKNRQLCDQIFDFLEKAMEIAFGPLDMFTFGQLTRFGLNP
jgi:hypothetical protein